jgi:hypothetical protein
MLKITAVNLNVIVNTLDDYSDCMGSYMYRMVPSNRNEV